MQVANRTDCRIATPIINRRQCRAYDRVVHWRNRRYSSGGATVVYFVLVGVWLKFYTAYCASSHHENILCNFGTNLHFCVIFNCCEARTVNCTRAVEHRNEIAKCFLTVGILGTIQGMLKFFVTSASAWHVVDVHSTKRNLHESHVYYDFSSVGTGNSSTMSQHYCLTHQQCCHSWVFFH